MIIETSTAAKLIHPLRILQDDPIDENTFHVGKRCKAHPSAEDTASALLYLKAPSDVDAAKPVHPLRILQAPAPFIPGRGNVLLQSPPVER